MKKKIRKFRKFRRVKYEQRDDSLCSGLVLIESSTVELPATSTEGVSNLDFDVMFSARNSNVLGIFTRGLRLVKAALYILCDIPGECKHIVPTMTSND